MSDKGRKYARNDTTGREDYWREQCLRHEDRIAELEHRLSIWSITHTDEVNQLQADKEDLERTIEEAISFLRNDAYRTRVINALMVLEEKR